MLNHSTGLKVIKADCMASSGPSFYPMVALVFVLLPETQRICQPLDWRLCAYRADVMYCVVIPQGSGHAVGAHRTGKHRIHNNSRQCIQKMLIK